MTFREWLRDKDEADFVDYTYSDGSDYDVYDYISVKEAKELEDEILNAEVVRGEKIDVEDTYLVDLKAQ